MKRREDGARCNGAALYRMQSRFHDERLSSSKWTNSPDGEPHGPEPFGRIVQAIV